MFKIKHVDQCPFGAKAERRAGCYVRSGLLSVDIRMLPALLLRDRAGAIGGIIFHDTGMAGAGRHAREQLEEALQRFQRRGLETGQLECAVVGGNPTRTWQIDAWRSAAREVGLKLTEHETTGSFYRQLFFEPGSGQIEVYREAASADQGNPGKATLSLNDSTQVFRGTDAQGVVANATRFFREKKSFQGLKEWVVPEHIAEQPGQPFRLWSACCSNGVEAYSYAMFLHRYFQYMDAPTPVGVIGTDINEDLLATAREGRYKVGAVELEKFQHYFDAYATTKGDTVTFGPMIKRFVSFRPHDIKKPVRKHRFRVIICANVFQYYQDDARLHFLRNFAAALESPGYLYVGPVREDLAQQAGLALFGRYGFLVKS